MKKIITTVGTSLLSNAIENNRDIKQPFKKLQGKFNADKDKEENQEQLKKLTKYTETLKTLDDDMLSAEITSLMQIQKEINDDLDVYLIATDTILSPFCAEIIKSNLENRNISVHFNSAQDIIKDLQIKDKENFEKEGIPNLLERLNSIAQNGIYWDDIILNITGGYKGIIPFMTIIGQVNKLPIYYIFEESDNEKYQLIKIPDVPISYDTRVFDTHWQTFENVKKEGLKLKSDIENFFDFSTEAGALIYSDNDSLWLTPIGNILWDKYKKQHFIFYCPDDVWDEIDLKHQNIKRIIQTKFHDEKQRKIEPKGTHKNVHDDGNNSFRIYFFVENNKLFIYKTFENHDLHEKYINATIFDSKFKHTIINDSKIRKLEIKQ